MKDRNLVFVILFIQLMLLSNNTYAANQVVTNNADSGAGTLRQAIADVGVGEEITFNLSIGNEVITTSTELVIDKSLTINGSNISGSGSSVTIQAAFSPGTANHRVILITNALSESSITVYLSDVSILNGRIQGSDILSGSGSGILVHAYAPNVLLNVQGCTISGNQSNFDGGGISNYISNENGYEAFTSTLIIDSSTINDNYSGTNGGGIFNFGNYDYDNCDAFLLINNSTLTGNYTANGGKGGGIYNNSYSQIQIANSTIVGNWCGGSSLEDTHNGYGGGFYNEFDSDSYLVNSIIINNKASDVSGGHDIYIAPTSNCFAYFSWGVLGSFVEGTLSGTINTSTDYSYSNVHGGIGYIAGDPQYSLEPLGTYNFGETETMPMYAEFVESKIKEQGCYVYKDASGNFYFYAANTVTNGDNNFHKLNDSSSSYTAAYTPATNSYNLSGTIVTKVSGGEDQNEIPRPQNVGFIGISMGACQYQDEETPLPVTLSSFTASFSTGSSLLSWTTQSESNNSGWNIYRSETENIEDYVQINEDMIEGAGTTTEQTDYTFADANETYANNSYWYWIESVDNGGTTTLHGPARIDIPESEDELPPELITSYGLAQNYPNPFNPNTKIAFKLKAEDIENAELIIYNSRGQKVKIFTNLMTGENEIGHVDWDGTDSEGNAVSSGIYMYKMKAGGRYTSTKKMILLK